MSDYLKVLYNKNNRPYTDYPNKLIHHLFGRFKMQKGMKLLEPGCGRGEHLRIYRDLGLEVYGMDISPEAPELASDLDISVCNLDQEKLPYPDNFFDVVYSKSFLEHLEDPVFFLKEAFRVLKPGGIIISMVPDWESQYQTFYDDPTHVSPFTFVSLRNIKLMNGFEKVDIQKFRQLPIVWRFPSIKYLCIGISPFISIRTKIPFFRWSRELMLLGFASKPKINNES